MTRELKPERLRIAFFNPDGASWTAGTNYLKNLFVAIKAAKSDVAIEIVLLVSPGTQSSDYGNLLPYVDHFLSIPTHSRLFRLWQGLLLRIEQRWDLPPGLESLLGLYLRRQKISCVFGFTTEYGLSFSVPWLFWIPDFQHQHLPDMFPVREIQDRNQRYLHASRNAARVVLSSQDALNDFQRFAPHLTPKARVIPFVAQVPTNVYDLDPGWVCDYYHLPKRFFYLPNQFWKHKNHDVVIRALEFAKLQNADVTVVCTGNTNEFRDPLYFAQLLATVSIKNLRDNFIILGIVPHEHLFQLMRQAVAVLQPSLFEGWSTTVEEAKSVGKGMILSDLPVHREQNPSMGLFFKPEDARALASLMVGKLKEKDAGPDLDLELIARKQLPERIKAFGQQFVAMIHELPAT